MLRSKSVALVFLVCGCIGYVIIGPGALKRTVQWDGRICGREWIGGVMYPVLSGAAVGHSMVSELSVLS